MWETKLLISPVKIRIFCPKLALLFILGQLIWCPVGGLVGGCGAPAVSRKTPIYFITFKLFSSSRLGCNIGDKKSLWAKKVRLSILSIGIGQST